MDRRVLAGVFAGGWVVVVTGPEQHAATVQSWCGTNNCPPEEQCDVCALAGRADELQRERDEARGSAQRWQDECRAILDTATGFEQERNEARREADQLRAERDAADADCERVMGKCDQLRAALGVAYTAIERATFVGVQADNKDSA